MRCGVSEGAPRLDKAHPTTVKRAFVRAGIPVAARRPREKPLRPTKAKKARALWCKTHSHFKSTYFADDVDLIIDNKKFEIPTSERAQATREVPFAHTVGRGYARRCSSRAGRRIASTRAGTPRSRGVVCTRALFGTGRYGRSHCERSIAHVVVGCACRH